jgi:hypothetical protein
LLLVTREANFVEAGFTMGSDTDSTASCCHVVPKDGREVVFG